MSSAIIEVTDVKKAFLVGTQTVEILHGITASINMGDFVIIVGPSGCGKSTLLHIILGLEKPSEGEVVFLEERIYNDTTEDYRSDFRKKHIGMVYQQPNWVKSMTVAENVGFPMLLLGMEREAARERAITLLDKLKMREWADYMPTELSGGQQQRVSLARALSNNPEIIIADEPTGNLDFQTGQEVMLMLQELNQTEKKTIVMVTHDLEYLKYANSAIKMFDGHIDAIYNGDQIQKLLNISPQKRGVGSSIKIDQRTQTSPGAGTPPPTPVTTSASTTTLPPEKTPETELPPTKPAANPEIQPADPTPPVTPVAIEPTSSPARAPTLQKMVTSKLSVSPIRSHRVSTTKIPFATVEHLDDPSPVPGIKPTPKKTGPPRVKQ